MATDNHFGYLKVTFVSGTISNDESNFYFFGIFNDKINAALLDKFFAILDQQAI